MAEEKKNLAMAILAAKPEADSDDETDEQSEKVIAAEELQSVLSTGSAEEVAEAFQSLVTLCM